MVFIDTNIWVYALSSQDHAKKKVAVELIAKTYRDDMICVSSQVLKEFANFAFRKTRKFAAEINAMLSRIGSYTFVADTKELVADGVTGRETWQVGFYDALIIAAANKAGCTTIFTEDLNNGQKYGNVVAINPFDQFRR
ncbi:MAG: PIN domain-containing protein [Kiritimatiellae bacterium]|nr:PIN domain-containing protein [Kiritimatiellia bacterium]